MNQMEVVAMLLILMLKPVSTIGQVEEMPQILSFCHSFYLCLELKLIFLLMKEMHLLVLNRTSLSLLHKDWLAAHFVFPITAGENWPSRCQDFFRLSQDALAFWVWYFSAPFLDDPTFVPLKFAVKPVTFWKWNTTSLRVINPTDPLFKNALKKCQTKNHHCHVWLNTMAQMEHVMEWCWVLMHCLCTMWSLKLSKSWEILYHLNQSHPIMFSSGTSKTLEQQWKYHISKSFFRRVRNTHFLKPSL